MRGAASESADSPFRVPVTPERGTTLQSVLRIPRVVTALALLAAGAGLSGCATGSSDTGAALVVRVAPSAHPVDLEVHLTQAQGGYREVRTMRSGETRRFAVPAGWVTVRVPGLCVVPARNRGTAVVEVDRDACRLV